MKSSMQTLLFMMVYLTMTSLPLVLSSSVSTKAAVPMGIQIAPTLMEFRHGPTYLEFGSFYIPYSRRENRIDSCQAIKLSLGYIKVLFEGMNSNALGTHGQDPTSALRNQMEARLNAIRTYFIPHQHDIDPDERNYLSQVLLSDAVKQHLLDQVHPTFNYYQQIKTVLPLMYEATRCNCVNQGETTECFFESTPTEQSKPSAVNALHTFATTHINPSLVPTTTNPSNPSNNLPASPLTTGTSGTSGSSQGSSGSGSGSGSSSGSLITCTGAGCTINEDGKQVPIGETDMNHANGHSKNDTSASQSLIKMHSTAFSLLLQLVTIAGCIFMASSIFM